MLILPQNVQKCANCGATHIANSPRCASRHQADMKAKEKKKKEKEKEKMQAENKRDEARQLSLQLGTEMEIEENWTPSSEPEAVDYEEWESQDEIPERRDYTKDF